MCATCLVPLVLLLVVLRLAAWLEGVALRHPLLFWLVPLAVHRRAERLDRETSEYCQRPQHGQQDYTITDYHR